MVQFAKYFFYAIKLLIEFDNIMKATHSEKKVEVGSVDYVQCFFKKAYYLTSTIQWIHYFDELCHFFD